MKKQLELMTSEKLFEMILDNLQGFSGEYDTKLSFSVFEDLTDGFKNVIKVEIPLDEDVVKQGVLNYSFFGIKLKENSIEIEYDDATIRYEIEWIEAYNILEEDDICLEIRHSYKNLGLFFKLKPINHFKYDWELDEYGEIDKDYYIEDSADPNILEEIELLSQEKEIFNF